MSAPPASYHRLKEVSRQLPADEAVREARRLGFTTIVLDKGNLSLLAWGNRIDQAVRDGTTSLRHLYATAAKTAYEIIPEAAERPPPAAGR
jgi:hypothetical protein